MLEEGKGRDSFFAFVRFILNEQFLLILMTQEHKDGGKRRGFISSSSLPNFCLTEVDSEKDTKSKHSMGKWNG